MNAYVHIQANNTFVQSSFVQIESQKERSKSKSEPAGQVSLIERGTNTLLSAILGYFFLNQTIR